MKKFTSLVLALCIAAPTSIFANTPESNQSTPSGSTFIKEIVGLAGTWYLTTFAVGLIVGIKRMSDPPTQRVIRAIGRPFRIAASERVGAKEVALFGYTCGLWFISTLKRIDREMRWKSR